VPGRSPTDSSITTARFWLRLFLIVLQLAAVVFFYRQGGDAFFYQGF
jgi:hypothetical protein